MNAQPIRNSLYALMCLLVPSACTSFEHMDYPAAWPNRTSAAGCQSLSGVYLNQGEDQSGSPAFLDRVISEGVEGSVKANGDISAVRIEADVRYIVRRYGQNWSPQHIPFLSEWNCANSGRWRAIVRRAASGEGSIGVQALHEFEAASGIDGSLIVRRVIKFHGGFPSGGGSETWMRFYRLPGSLSQ